MRPTTTPAKTYRVRSSARTKPAARASPTTATARAPNRASRSPRAATSRAATATLPPARPRPPPRLRRRRQRVKRYRSSISTRSSPKPTHYCSRSSNMDEHAVKATIAGLIAKVETLQTEKAELQQQNVACAQTVTRLMSKVENLQAQLTEGRVETPHH